VVLRWYCGGTAVVLRRQCGDRAGVLPGWWRRRLIGDAWGDSWWPAGRRLDIRRLAGNRVWRTGPRRWRHRSRGVRWGFRDLQDEDDHALTMGLGRSQFDRGAAMPPVA